MKQQTFGSFRVRDFGDRRGGGRIRRRLISERKAYTGPTSDESNLRHIAACRDLACPETVSSLCWLCRVTDLHHHDGGDQHEREAVRGDDGHRVERESVD